MKELIELLGVLHKIFPKEETINPFYKVELSDYPTTYNHCYKLLAHYFTLIYKNHRAIDKSRYITSREDIIASLNLLEIMTLKNYRTHQKTVNEIYITLKSNTKAGQIIAARNIREIFNISKTQSHRYIKALTESGKIEKVSTHHKSIGYLYQLK